MKHVEILKAVFLGGDVFILQETCRRVFSSTGKIKGKTMSKFGETLFESFSTRTKKYALFEFNNLEAGIFEGKDFAEFNISCAVEIKGKYEQALRFLFSDQTLRRLLEIFSFLMKIKKTKDSIGKSWKRLKLIQSHNKGIFKILQQIFLIVNDFFDCLRSYLSFQVIEPLYKQLRKGLMAVTSFQQTFKCLTEFLKKVHFGVLLSKDHVLLMRQVMGMIKQVCLFYRIVG